jgi:hypothetical protein
METKGEELDCNVLHAMNLPRDEPAFWVNLLCRGEGEKGKKAFLFQLIGDELVITDYGDNSIVPPLSAYGVDEPPVK